MRKANSKSHYYLNVMTGEICKFAPLTTNGSTGLLKPLGKFYSFYSDKCFMVTNSEDRLSWTVILRKTGKTVLQYTMTESDLKIISSLVTYKLKRNETQG